MTQGSCSDCSEVDPLVQVNIEPAKRIDVEKDQWREAVAIKILTLDFHVGAMTQNPFDHRGHLGC